MRGFFFFAFLVLHGACAPRTPSSPEGVDITPLTKLAIKPDARLVSRIKQELGLPERHPLDLFPRPGLVIFRQPEDDTSGQIFRSVSLSYYETDKSTSMEFDENRKTFGDAAQDWSIYKESGNSPERYFISFKGVRWDSNHGIPMAVNTKPDILVAIQKPNLFITVSYNAYRDGTDYVTTMNSDIQFAARVIGRAAAPR